MQLCCLVEDDKLAKSLKSIYFVIEVFAICEYPAWGTIFSTPLGV